MADKHTKRYSTFYIIRKIQTNTTLRYHCTSIRNGQHSEATNSIQMLMKIWSNKELSLPLCWKTIWQFLTKLNKPYDPAMALHGYFPKELENLCPMQTPFPPHTDKLYS